MTTPQERLRRLLQNTIELGQNERKKSWTIHVSLDLDQDEDFLKLVSSKRPNWWFFTKGEKD